MNILAGPRRRYIVLCHAVDITIIHGRITPADLARPGIQTEYNPEDHTTICREKIPGPWMTYERSVDAAITDAAACLSALSAEPPRHPHLPIIHQPSAISH